MLVGDEERQTWDRFGQRSSSLVRRGGWVIETRAASCKKQRAEPRKRRCTEKSPQKLAPANSSATSRTRIQPARTVLGPERPTPLPDARVQSGTRTAHVVRNTSAEPKPLGTSSRHRTIRASSPADK